MLFTIQLLLFFSFINIIKFNLNFNKSTKYMNSLNRKHRKPDGANKYYINCNELEKNPSIIPIIFNKIIKNENVKTILQMRDFNEKTS